MDRKTQVAQIIEDATRDHLKPKPGMAIREFFAWSSGGSTWLMTSLVNMCRLLLRLPRIRVRGRLRLLGVRWIVPNITIRTRITAAIVPSRTRISRTRISHTRTTTVIVQRVAVGDNIADERLLLLRHLNGREKVDFGAY
jgi:hypothetical protein